LQDLVQAKLELEWSPEQIAAWLRLTYPDRRAWHVCHETIYQAIYHGGNRGLTRKLIAKLRTGRPLRKRGRKPTERATRFIAQGCLIDERPLIVEERSRVGDWKGDLIVGRASRSALGNLVDRSSRCLRLIRLPAGHGAEAFAAAGRCSSRRATAGPGIRAARWPATTCWPACWSTVCSLLTRPVRGSGLRMKTL
jgi:IS30 family transposase